MEGLKETIKLKSNPVQFYKDRVRAIKPLLPANWKEIVIKHYPEFNTIKGGDLMTNVFLLRSSHVQLTEIMERIAKKELL